MVRKDLKKNPGFLPWYECGWMMVHPRTKSNTHVLFGHQDEQTASGAPSGGSP
jgi:hypothetical protein